MSDSQAGTACDLPCFHAMAGHCLALSARSLELGGVIKAFLAYSQADEKSKRNLIAALSPLERRNLLTVWHFRLLPIGREWKPEVSFHLRSAEIILLLISSDFINSDYCYGIEMATALELHDNGQARVVPILLRDCLWKGLPFSRLQLLPTDAKPVRNWQNKDSAWTDVAKGIQSAIHDFRDSSGDDRVTRERTAMAGKTPQNNFFDVAAAGNTTVSAEDEPNFAVKSVRLCEHTMRTISYRENDWWHDEAGQRYLNEQKLFLARKGRIERVFIIPEGDEKYSLASLADSLDQQSRLGIEVFYVYEQDIPAGYFAWVQDFILYDDKLLRVSTTVPPDGLLGRPALLHTDSDMLRRGLQWFNGLKALSTPWAVAE